MASDTSGGFRHISLQIRKTQPRMWRKKQTNKHGLGSAPSAKRGKSIWHFCAALRGFTGYRGRVFCAKLPQNHLEYWLISRLPCFHLFTASFCWLCPSLDSYLKPTVLFCPSLSFGYLCLLWDLPSLLHFRSRGRSRPEVIRMGFAPK